jgi:hypothetical protein
MKKITRLRLSRGIGGLLITLEKIWRLKVKYFIIETQIWMVQDSDSLTNRLRD